MTKKICWQLAETGSPLFQSLIHMHSNPSSLSFLMSLEGTTAYTEMTESSWIRTDADEQKPRYSKNLAHSELDNQVSLCAM